MDVVTVDTSPKTAASNLSQNGAATTEVQRTVTRLAEEKVNTKMKLNRPLKDRSGKKNKPLRL